MLPSPHLPPSPERSSVVFSHSPNDAPLHPSLHPPSLHSPFLQTPSLGPNCHNNNRHMHTHTHTHTHPSETLVAAAATIEEYLLVSIEPREVDNKRTGEMPSPSVPFKTHTHTHTQKDSRSIRCFDTHITYPYFTYTHSTHTHTTHTPRKMQI
eukprot:GHVR01029132.1.p1 GENE.GHVR01029132.1~~GHVR01029132.1.p1  ORF type:complete len:153 (+),score=64.92 GHVR01029132.1:175-633(+)